MFKEVSKLSFSDREKEVLDFWKAQSIFERSIKERQDAPLFTTYDGPPFATGLPHYGHLLAGTIKDVVLRYKTMKGHYVPRRFAWDCHGIPVESQIEKQYELSGAPAIESFGIDRFNEACRSIVQRYTGEWKKTVERMGRWVNMDDPTHTMDLDYMETVWWVFKEIYEKGLVYKGFKVMPFSAALGTPLSNFEAGENYKDVDDPSLTIAFPLVEDPETALLIWTTTPWTLPSNKAAAAGADIPYVKIQDQASGKKYILAESRLKAYYKEADGYSILESFLGIKLEGVEYIPPFDYFTDSPGADAFRVLIDPVVGTEEGTGIVHMAPAFGEADFYACQDRDIELACPVDQNGRFTVEVPEYTGQFVKDADKDLIRRLKEAGRVFHQGTIRHRYPFCPRTETPIIYRAMTSWFVAVERIKDQILEVAEEMHWTPTHLKKGRWGNWLVGARDWAISRNRYWGTPIPLWVSDEGDYLCVGSCEELEELTGTKIDDLHRHFIDQLTFTKDGKTYRRISEVFDCWFESGSMPYAQSHYPFENKESFDRSFPADFIAEGLDQTRGWFYTLTILGAALFKKPAFKNVIVNGIILASDGAKMSKRLQNYPDPQEVIQRYGADAIRLYMLHSPAVKGDDLRFEEKGVELVLRQILIPWWNAYSFFITYARLYEWTPSSLQTEPPSVDIDRWILACLHQLIHRVEKGMDSYDLNLAVEPFVDFIDQLTNWYIRRSRRRFWDEKPSADRDSAFATLYTVLVELSKVAAAYVPFIAEEMYQNLRTEEMPDSVHLCDFPHYDEKLRDRELEAAMDYVQAVVSLGHSLRKERKLKVRQPLATAHVLSSNQQVLDSLSSASHLIADELNVKDVQFSVDEKRFVSLSAKPNFPVLGRKAGKHMRSLQQTITSFNQEQCQTLFEGNSLALSLNDMEWVLEPEDVLVDRKVREGLVAANAGEITIALETELNDALILEGLAREIVNKINTMRREAGLEVSDRISVQMDATELVQQSMEQWSHYVHEEVLALNWTFGPCEGGQEWDLNGELARITIKKEAYP